MNLKTSHWYVVGTLLACFLVTSFIRRHAKEEISTQVEKVPRGKRMIPFLPGLIRAAELASKGDLYKLNVKDAIRVENSPYDTVKEICSVPAVSSAKRGEDLIMNEISIGNCGSTWQLIVISNLVKQHGYRLPVVHVQKGTTESWPGLRNLHYNEKKEWGSGPTFGRLFKIQHEVPELLHASSLVFNAFKLLEGKEADVNRFAQGVCPCCFVVKDALGNEESEIALIYMHAFALGLDLSEKQVREIRVKQAEWIKLHYCYPGSAHQSACQVLEEFPELKDLDFDPSVYQDLE